MTSGVTITPPPDDREPHVHFSACSVSSTTRRPPGRNAPFASADWFADRETAARTWPAMAPLLAGRQVMRRSPDGGVTFSRYRRGGRGRKLEVALSLKLPNQPTAVPVGDINTLTGRLNVLDLDAKHAPAGVLDRAAYVAEVATAVERLVAECGGRVIVDASPSGGRHVYMVWARSRPFCELKQLAYALAARFGPVVDVAPMQHPDGMIRSPGAPHRIEDGRLTGYMRLVGELEDAVETATAGNGPDVWNALVQELTAEYEALQQPRAQAAPTNGAEAADETGPAEDGAAVEVPVSTDASGAPWRPRLGGRRPLGTAMARLAQTGDGDWAGAGYRSGSEARYAVVASAVAAGWRLEQLQEEMRQGRMPGLADLYADARSWKGRPALVHEWHKAARTSRPPAGSPQKSPLGRRGGEPASQSYTSGLDTTRPPSGGGGPEPELEYDDPSPSHEPQPGNIWGLRAAASDHHLNDWQRIRTWWSAVLVAEADPGRLDQWEAAGISPLSARLVLRALGAAAQMCGTIVVEFGVRALELMTGLHTTTVGRVLRALRDESAPLIDLVRVHRRKRADTYALVVPEPCAAEAAWMAWRAGRIEALHPAYFGLSGEGGGAAALVYEVLTGREASRAELIRLSGVKDASIDRALQLLAEHGLAERVRPGEWRRGPVSLDEVALTAGGYDERDARLAVHRADRAVWWDLIASWEAGSAAAVDRLVQATHIDPAAQASEDDRYIPAGHAPDLPPDDLDDPDGTTPITITPTDQPDTVPTAASTAAPPIAAPRPSPTPENTAPNGSGPHRATITPGSGDHFVPAPAPPADDAPAEPLDPVHRGAALARRLLAARPEDRDAILTAHETGPSAET